MNHTAEFESLTRGLEARFAKIASASDSRNEDLHGAAAANRNAATE